MALQWTPIRRRGGAVVRARQNVQTLEHQTQNNVLLAFKLSMVSANGAPAVTRPNLRTTYRKMADAGVQYEPQDLDSVSFSVLDSESVVVNSTVAEINTSSEIVEPSQPSLHRPLSFQSSSSSSGSGSSGGGGGGDEQERKRSANSDNSRDLDVNAIFVQQSETATDGDVTAHLNKPSDKTEPDGFLIEEKEEPSSCGLTCLSFTMQCCECTIL